MPDLGQSDGRDPSYTVSITARTGIGRQHIVARLEEAIGIAEDELKRAKVRVVTIVRLDHEESRL